MKCHNSSNKFMSQYTRKSHVALQYLKISIAYPRTYDFNECVGWGGDGGNGIIGLECAIVEE